MNGKTYAVVGATGHVGSVVAEELKAQGRNVRLVSRRSGVSIDDIGALTDAFSGTDGVFLMIPAETNAPDLRARQNEIGGKLVDALKKAHAKRVVFLSSLNAQYETGTGPVLGLHDMENRLNALDIDEVIHLRPAYFMGFGACQASWILWNLVQVGRRATDDCVERYRENGSEPAYR